MENKRRISTPKGLENDMHQRCRHTSQRRAGAGRKYILETEKFKLWPHPSEGGWGGDMYLEHGQTLTATLLVWIVTARRLQKLWNLLRIDSSAFSCNFSHERRAPVLRSLFILSSLSSITTKIRTLIRPRGGQGIQAWTLRTH